MSRWSSVAFLGLALAATGIHPAQAQDSAELQAEALKTWLVRIHEAAQSRNYRGTFVVSSAGRMTSARIVHMCEDGVQFERIDVLDGQPRRIYRRDDVVHTLNPDIRVALVEQREALKTFPALLGTSVGQLADHYRVDPRGQDRVAGRHADVMELTPRDSLRFGHRLWADQASGLLLRSEIIDERGRVLEASAFSEVSIDVPFMTETIALAAQDLDGYDVRQVAVQETTLDQEGWAYRNVPPGFRHVQCVKRESPNPGMPVLQTIFSDGLAHVSIFVEPYEARTARKEQLLGMGATHSLSSRHEQWWVTVVGEVPPATLKAFARGLERIKR